MSNWINSNGGLLLSVGAIIGSFNLVMSTIASVCNKLKLQEPGWMQKLGVVGSTFAAWFGSNIPSVPSPKPGDGPVPPVSG